MLLQLFLVIAPLTDGAFIISAALTGNAQPQARDNRLGLIAHVCVQMTCGEIIKRGKPQKKEKCATQ